jgi:hypothetical protein
VASGQLKPGERQAFFSWANFKKCTFFGIQMFRIGWLLVGFLLMLGKLGTKGEDFLVVGNENLHDFLDWGMFRIG